MSPQLFKALESTAATRHAAIDKPGLFCGQCVNIGLISHNELLMIGFNRFICRRTFDGRFPGHYTSRNADV